MQITDKDLQKFRDRAKTELQSNGAVGRLAWDTVVNALCNEVEELRKNAAPGDAAAMRESIETMRRYAMIPQEQLSLSLLQRTIHEKCDAALAAPARNCDVGTAQEQIDRFHEFCHSNRVYIDEFHGYDCRPDCPIGKIVDRDNKFCDNCWAAWAQMPYAPAQEGGAE